MDWVPVKYGECKTVGKYVLTAFDNGSWNIRKTGKVPVNVVNSMASNLEVAKSHAVKYYEQYLT